MLRLFAFPRTDREFSNTGPCIFQAKGVRFHAKGREGLPNVFDVPRRSFQVRIPQFSPRWSTISYNFSTGVPWIYMAGALGAASRVRRRPRLLICGTSTNSNGAFALTMRCVERLVRSPCTCHEVLTMAFAGGTATRVGRHVLRRLCNVTATSRNSRNCLGRVRGASAGSIRRVQRSTQRTLQRVVRSCDHFHVRAVSSFFRSIVHGLTQRLRLKTGLSVRLGGARILDSTISTVVRGLSQHSPILC